MRILILHIWYYPNLIGGAEHSVKLLAEGLVKEGHEVAVMTIDNKEKSVAEEVINGVKVYRSHGGWYNIYRAYSVKRGLILGAVKKGLELCNPSILPQVKEVYSRFRPDVVHANGLAGISLSSLSFFKDRGVPIVYTVRDYYLDNMKNVDDEFSNISFIFKLFLPLYRTYSKCQTHKVSAFVAISTYIQNYMTKGGYFRDVRKNVIFNCVNYDIEKTQKCIADKDNHKKCTFIFAARLSDEKGLPQMLEAFHRTKIESTLTICGDGDRCDIVRDYVAKDNRIIYKGKLTPEQLDTEYQKADVVLVPSLWAEPFGRVVIEGAKNGLVVAGSNRGGIPEIIGNLKCGVTFNPTIVDEIQHSIELLYNADLSKYRKHIPEKLVSYSLKSHIDSYLNVYNQVISRS